MRFVLFTSFSPDTGGGAKNLRTLIPAFAATEINWCYLAPQEKPGAGRRWVGPPISGGSIFTDLWKTAGLWSGLLRRRIRQICDELERARPDGYWVVAHNEGILVGLELIRRGCAPIHVTVQDDQEFGMYRRSKRYALLARMTRGSSRALLRRASSCDVTSDGMRDYYQRLIARNSIVVHPIMEEPAAPTGISPLKGCIRVGHIGNLYSISEMRVFCSALASVAAARQVKVVIVMIGLSSRNRLLEGEGGVSFEFIEHLPEVASVQALEACDFVYAMYPFDKASEVFRMTSFPTKLTTYIDARRPIFAHAPEPSTLAEFVRHWQVGTVSTSLDETTLTKDIAATLDGSFAPDRFNLARRSVFGRANAEGLEQVLHAHFEPRSG